MPPGAAGSAESGSGASLVQITKPSGMGSPAATPSAKGSPLVHCAVPALARPIAAGAAAQTANPAAARKKLRRATRRFVPLALIFLFTPARRRSDCHSTAQEVPLAVLYPRNMTVALRRAGYWDC